MFKNKIVKFAVLGLASFAVINVGMYFFLQMTQPKMGARSEAGLKVEKSLGKDSTSTMAIADKGEPASTSTKESSQTATAQATTTAPAEQSVVAASLASPETPAMPPPPEPDKSVSSVDSTPVASAPEAAPKETEVAAADLQADTKEMAKLAKLLESVKPDEAAAIAAKLDVEQIVALVMKMKDRNAGKMLAALPSDQAARVALRMTQMATQTKGKE